MIQSKPWSLLLAVLFVIGAVLGPGHLIWIYGFHNQVVARVPLIAGSAKPSNVRQNRHPGVLTVLWRREPLQPIDLWPAMNPIRVTFTGSAYRLGTDPEVSRFILEMKRGLDVVFSSELSLEHAPDEPSSKRPVPIDVSMFPIEIDRADSYFFKIGKMETHGSIVTELQVVIERNAADLDIDIAFGGAVIFMVALYLLARRFEGDNA